MILFKDAEFKDEDCFTLSNLLVHDILNMETDKIINCKETFERTCDFSNKSPTINDILETYQSSNE